jgi:hypothetical protein
VREFVTAQYQVRKKNKIMKTEKEKIELEIKKLTDKRDNSSDTFNRIRLSNQIKKLKDKLEKLS